MQGCISMEGNLVAREEGAASVYGYTGTPCANSQVDIKQKGISHYAIQYERGTSGLAREKGEEEGEEEEEEDAASVYGYTDTP